MAEQKFGRIVSEIKGQINRGKYQVGQKIPSENELAKKYGVSRQTVRKALSSLQEDDYITAVHGKGTFVKQRIFHSSTTKNIAVITTYMSDYIFPRVIQGINRELSDAGYNVILKNTNNSRTAEGRVIEELLIKDVAGMIIEPAQSAISCRHSVLYDQMDEIGIPYVFIQGCFEEMLDRPHVMLDDEEGGYRITKHMLDKGITSIAGIFKVDDIQGKLRHKGYARALQEANIAYDPDKVIFYHTQDKSAKPRTQLLSILEDNIKKNKVKGSNCCEQIQGVVCYNDEIASDIIRALKENDYKVPDDISVTGFDYSLMAKNMGITTVNHPQEELGRQAARLLLELIENPTDVENIEKANLLSPVVIEGKTVRAY